MKKKIIIFWIHFFMVMALFAILYTVFAGLSFYSGGDFFLAATASAIIVLCISLFFIIPQQLKGRDGNFRKMIIIERYCIFPLGPLSLLLASFPISHFLSIQLNKSQIIQQLSSAADTTNKMFVDYEVYASHRIQRYESTLRHKSNMVRENKREALRLQLLSANYDLLRFSALEWIDASTQNPSIPIAFISGNIKGFRQAIVSWNSQLYDLSTKRLSDEPAGCEPFTDPSSSAIAATTILDNLSNLYRHCHPFSYQAVLVMVILWLLLMLPYLYQQRHCKSTEHLFGNKL